MLQLYYCLSYFASNKVQEKQIVFMFIEHNFLEPIIYSLSLWPSFVLLYTPIS